jgi:hypothetical protein
LALMSAPRADTGSNPMSTSVANAPSSTTTSAGGSERSPAPCVECSVEGWSSVEAAEQG